LKTQKPKSAAPQSAKITDHLTLTSNAAPPAGFHRTMPQIFVPFSLGQSREICCGEVERLLTSYRSQRTHPPGLVNEVMSRVAEKPSNAEDQRDDPAKEEQTPT
jgi:hypothetical protein